MEFSVDGCRVVVVGAARSGMAAAKLLHERGARVIVADLRASVDGIDRLGPTGIAVELGQHREATFTAADLLVLSPGVPPDQPAVAAARRRGVPVISELELASRWVRGRIVAITGTKGKSTTATLAGRILDRAGVHAIVGGNIGTALSGQIDRTGPDVVHVVEVSSFQLELAETFHPWISVFLNLTADHLDRHGSMEAYGHAKARIFANQDQEDWAVVNADDRAVIQLAGRGRARQLRFAVDASLDDGIVITGDTIARHRQDEDIPLVPLASVKTRGPHLLADTLAAVAVGFLAGASPHAMTQALDSFNGLEHALEPVSEVGGVLFVDDSKATNIEAARRAIECFDRDLVVILGGRFKGGDFRDLASVLRGRARAIIAIGEAQPLVRAAIASTVDVYEAGSMGEAVRTAFTVASPGGTVLLAPACASVDMFRDYAERGRMFAQEVARLAVAVEGAREQ